MAVLGFDPKSTWFQNPWSFHYTILRLSIHLSVCQPIDSTIHLSIHPPIHLTNTFLAPTMCQVTKVHALMERYRQEAIKQKEAEYDPLSWCHQALGVAHPLVLTPWLTLYKVPYLSVPLFLTRATKLWTRNRILSFLWPQESLLSP